MVPCRITGGYGIAALVNVDSKVVFLYNDSRNRIPTTNDTGKQDGLSVFQIIVPFYPQIWKKCILPWGKVNGNTIIVVKCVFR